jgi:hypothetical protein
MREALGLQTVCGAVMVRPREGLSPDEIHVYREGSHTRWSRLVEASLEAIILAVNELAALNPIASNRVDVPPRMFAALCAEAAQFGKFNDTACRRCGGTKEDPEHSGPCGECFERPAPPPMPRELREAYGRDAMLVQLDWLRSVGDAKGEAEAMRRLALWNRPQEEWELERPVLLRGAYRTPGEVDIELSWRVYYAGRRQGPFFEPTVESVVNAAMRMVGDSRRTASEQALLYSRAVAELGVLPAHLQTPTQLALRLATWMQHPRRAAFLEQAAAEREAIARRAEQLRAPWDYRIGFTFLGGPR